MFTRPSRNPFPAASKRAARPAAARRSATPPTGPVIRRAPACACGGTCPRCQGGSGLAIGAPDDALERQADAVADRVMRRAQPTTGQAASPAQAGEPMMAPASVGAALQHPGRPLDADTRSFFEPHFGADLSGVRVHTDASAEQSASDIGARAYTLGHHVAFAAGQFAPQTSEGRHLLAHELAHVAQQGSMTDGTVVQRVVDPRVKPWPPSPSVLAQTLRAYLLYLQPYRNRPPTTVRQMFNPYVKPTPGEFFLALNASLELRGQVAQAYEALYHSDVVADIVAMSTVDERASLLYLFSGPADYPEVPEGTSYA